MVRLQSLPPEVLSMIAKLVDPKDTVALRVQNRQISAAANLPFALAFLTERKHVVEIHSLAVLIFILDHPYWGPFVRSITLNAVRTAYMSEYARRTIFGNPDPDDDEFGASHRGFFDEHDRVTNMMNGFVTSGECGRYLSKIFLLIKRHAHAVTIGVSNTVGSGFGWRRLVIHKHVGYLFLLGETLNLLLDAAESVLCPIQGLKMEIYEHRSETESSVLAMYVQRAMQEALVRIQNINTEVTIMTPASGKPAVQNLATISAPSLSITYHTAEDDDKPMRLDYDRHLGTLDISNVNKRWGVWPDYAAHVWLACANFSRLTMINSNVCDLYTICSKHIFRHGWDLTHISIKDSCGGDAEQWAKLTSHLVKSGALQYINLSHVSVEYPCHHLLLPGNKEEFVAEGEKIKPALEKISAVALWEMELDEMYPDWFDFCESGEGVRDFEELLLESQEW